MAIAAVADLLRLAKRCRKEAEDAAKAIHLSTFTEAVKYAKSIGARMLGDEPAYSELPPFRGLRAWGALLSFDLRRSSARALEVGPRDTYVTMHTYLPTMLSLVECAGGIVVGLRGDGAIACFGLVELTEAGRKVKTAEADFAVGKACDCGDAMVKAIDAVVNPVLKEGNVRGGLQVGVGIDVGEIVATNIGLGDAKELTAYGNCVNKCCKRSTGQNEVVLTLDAKNMFPTDPKGRTGFRRYRDEADAFVLHYPPDYRTLQ